MNHDPINWMSRNLDQLGDLSLNELVIPASHDSGMYIARDFIFGANKCNTQTQTSTIIDQLNMGCRYFDIRPVLYASDSGTALYTGHYNVPEPISSDNFQISGANGPRLVEFFGQVDEFMQSSNDLVILKFSHYFDRTTNIEQLIMDSDNGFQLKYQSFDLQDFQALISQVEDALGKYLYKTELNGRKLSTMKLNDFIWQGGKVLAVYDQLLEDLYDQSKGIYRYTDVSKSQNKPPDLEVYDCYSNTNDVNKMVDDQKTKIMDPNNHGDNLYLLSWTLTQSYEQVVGCHKLLKKNRTSILQLADEANNCLGDTIQDWLDKDIINSHRIPNLIYIDAYAEFCLEIALDLTKRLRLETPLAF